MSTRTVASPIASKVSGLDLKGGLLYAGTGSNPTSAFNEYRNQWQPRVGVAWQFLPKWVLRAGYGLSYLGQAENGPATGFSQPTSLIAAPSGSFVPAVSLSDPFPRNFFQVGFWFLLAIRKGWEQILGWRFRRRIATVHCPIPINIHLDSSIR